MDYYKHIQVIILVVAAISDVVSLLEKINPLVPDMYLICSYSSGK